MRKEKIHIFTTEIRLKTEQALKLLEEARKATTEIVLIPTITSDGKDREGWARMAKRFQDAGAYSIELNMCCPNMSFNVQATGGQIEEATGARLGSDLLALPKVVKLISEAIEVPIIVKLTPQEA